MPGEKASGWERVALTPTSVAIENAGLSFCIQWAYKVKPYQVAGPDRLVSERYDIIAKSEKASNNEQMRAMMQVLLADRFGLRLHRDTRTVAIYNLIVASPAKLQRASPDQSAGMTVENGSFVFRRVTMAGFAERLTDFSTIDRPVLDRTGLDGSFDITLTSAPSAMSSNPDAIFAAVEGAGFRLNRSKAPIEILVVDHAEAPSAN